ncbi:MAG: hypothetical protein KIS79_06455, partial [Burkholderiales bacterium]|nr:hypothetical protein [Burkholderiales bacterium]
AAAAVAVKIRAYHFPAAVFTVVYLLFAAREADLHKAFTTRSISKLNYYRDATIPYSERIVAALVAIIILCVILYWLITVLRFLFIERGLHTRAGRWLAIGAGLLVLAKMLDRSEAVLTQILHMVRPEWIVGLSDSFEEGLELATPVLLTVSAWISQSDGRYLHPKKSAKQRRP